MAKHTFWIVAVLLFVIPFASASPVYKCKGPDGSMQYQDDPCAGDAQAVSSWYAQSGSDSDKPLVLSQGRGGHYFTDGSINGHFLNFVVDTGASYVTVPLEFATSAGLQCKDMGTMQTANGSSQVCHVVIESLSFGNFTLESVDALVAPNLNQALLGMNVLKRFHVVQDGDQMRLTRNY